jgi:hypothetical protein
MVNNSAKTATYGKGSREPYGKGLLVGAARKRRKITGSETDDVNAALVAAANSMIYGRLTRKPAELRRLGCAARRAGG